MFDSIYFVNNYVVKSVLVRNTPLIKYCIKLDQIVGIKMYSKTLTLRHSLHIPLYNNNVHHFSERESVPNEEVAWQWEDWDQ